MNLLLGRRRTSVAVKRRVSAKLSAQLSFRRALGTSLGHGDQPAEETGRVSPVVRRAAQLHKAKAMSAAAAAGVQPKRTKAFRALRTMGPRSSQLSQRSVDSRGSAYVPSLASVSVCRGTEILDDTEQSPVSELDALLRFVPKFVRQRCASGAPFDMLAENREVTVLFFVGKLQSSSATKEMMDDLQKLLGAMIDIAEGDFGGTTRQVTVDDKGLAAIFVFGLPGYLHFCHASQCILAAVRILPHIAECKRSVDVRAGVATGWCYCGLVGNPSSRCEYSVMGDAVNTAARLAGKAFALGHPVLCSENVEASVRKELKSTVTLTCVASVALKGKSQEMSVYVPDERQLTSKLSSSSMTGPFIGRQEEVETVAGFAYGRKGSVKAPRVLIVQGRSGIGKTELLRHICRLASTSAEDHVMTMFLDGSVYSGYQIFQQILAKLLQLDGCSANDSTRLSRLESICRSSLDLGKTPEMLSHHTPKLQQLRQSIDGEVGINLRSVYQDLIHRELRRRNLLLVVDNAHHLDDAVLDVLSSAVILDGSAMLTSTPRSKVILSSTKPLRLSLPGSQPQVVSPASDRHFVVVSLRALTRQEVCQFCQEYFSCKKVSDALGDWLYEQSSGVPLHLGEVCKWLADNFYVHVDPAGLATMKKDTEGVLDRAPELTKIVRGRIDQLSKNQGIVLRCASVLGVKFESRLLRKILPAGTVNNEDDLFEILSLLDVASMIFPLSELYMWQFKSSVYHEVAYDCMLHESKRKLHWQAAEHLRSALSQISEDSLGGHGLDARSYVEDEIVRHISRGMQMLPGSQDPNRATESRRFQGAASTINRIVEFNMSNGFVMRAWTHQANYHAAITDIDSTSILWLQEIKLYVNESTMRLLTRIRRLGGNVLDIPEGEQSAKLEELMQLNDRLLTELLQSNRDSDDEVLDEYSAVSRETSDTWLVSLLAQAKVTRCSAELVLKNRISDDTYESLLGWFRKAAHPKVRLTSAACACILSIVSGRFPAASAIAGEAMAAKGLVDGEAQLEHLLGIRLNSAVPLAWYVSRLMEGDVDPVSASSSLSAVVGRIPPGDRVVCRAVCRAYEGSWEPQSSPRVREWDSAGSLADAGETVLEWCVVGHFYSILLKAQAQLDSIEPALHSEPSNTAEVSSALSSWRALTSRAIKESLRSPLKVELFAIARNCVYEGCRVMLPMPCSAVSDDGRGSSPTCSVTSDGIKHMENAAHCLGRCLELMRGEGLGSSGLHIFSAGWEYVAAMLKWFHWRLRIAGCAVAGARGQQPQDELALHGTSGASLYNGLAEVCSALIDSQRLSLSEPGAPEVLTACLPATVALARLLGGEGTPDALPLFPVFRTKHDSSFRRTVYVPTNPQLSGGPGSRIGVARVEIRSSEARLVGARHLDQVLRLLVKDGQPLDLGAIRSPADLGGSVVAWEALELHRCLTIS
uniref:Adenylate cyclase 10 n=1 Tax=Tetraselmis sp. GSL018 TaxID=582737 RepID=A0A061QWC5_9CHLO